MITIGTKVRITSGDWIGDIRIVRGVRQTRYSTLYDISTRDSRHECAASMLAVVK